MSSQKLGISDTTTSVKFKPSLNLYALPKGSNIKSSTISQINRSTTRDMSPSTWELLSRFISTRCTKTSITNGLILMSRINITSQKSKKIIISFTKFKIM